MDDLDEANTGESCIIKQPQKQRNLNNAKRTSGFKIYNEFGHQIYRDLRRFFRQIGTEVFLRGESILRLTIQSEVDCGKK